MRTQVPMRDLFPVGFSAICLLALLTPGQAQSTATLAGRVLDPTGALVPGAEITVSHRETGVERIVNTDQKGNYQVAALPVGTYRVKVEAPGFHAQVLETLTVEVGRSIVQEFQRRIGNVSQQVIVTSNAALSDRASISVGQVIDQKTVQEIPLNGRYFLDLGLLIPGSVTPSQSGFSTTPSRGVGALAINTAGNREETVNYMINGITLNNLAFESISFQPSISTIQEFRVDNSTFSAEYGQTSGAIAN